MAESANETHDAPQKANPERDRSTITFPYGNLGTAMKIAAGIQAVGGTSCQWEQLAAHLNTGVTSAGFRASALTAKTFGLVTYDKVSLRVTLLGSRIVDPAQEASAKVEAFLHVPLYARLYKRYTGIKLRYNQKLWIGSLKKAAYPFA